MGKEIAVALLLLVFVLAVPVFWTISGWILVSAYEVLLAESVVEEFWSIKHMLVGLSLSVVAAAFRASRK